MPASVAARFLADVWDQNAVLHATSPINAKLEEVVEGAGVLKRTEVVREVFTVLGPTKDDCGSTAKACARCLKEDGELTLDKDAIKSHREASKRAARDQLEAAVR